MAEGQEILHATSLCLEWQVVYLWFTKINWAGTE